MERKSLTSRPVFAVRTKEVILEAKCQNRVDARLNAHMFGRELFDYFDKVRSSRAEHAKILTATVLTVGHFLQSTSTVNLYCYVAVQEHEFFFHELIDILKKLYEMSNIYILIKANNTFENFSIFFERSFLNSRLATASCSTFSL